MPPSPISPSSVHIALQYIAPPSQLDQPLPPFLLSKPLLQRHHFLQIPPDDPAQYLCWPSDTSAKAIDLLESLPRPVDDDTPHVYPVQYTSDVEHTYAHVALASAGEDDAVRLVFQWDEVDGWKFHDAKLMPFPQGSKPSLSEVLAPQAPAVGAPQPPAAVHEYNPYGFNDQSDDSDEDSYWNAYGADSDGSDLRDGMSSARDMASDGEDAYWARYATVQGTADSTIPSPPIQKRKLDPYSEYANDMEPEYPLPVPIRSEFSDPRDEVLHIPSSFVQHTQSTGSRRSDPASPKDLARRLAEISPRDEPSHIADFEDVEALELSPPLESDDSSDALGLITSAEASPSGLDEPQGVSELDGAVDLGSADAEDLALRQSLKGLYALWKLSRARKGISSSEQEDRAAFMKVVDTVIG